MQQAEESVHREQGLVTQIDFNSMNRHLALTSAASRLSHSTLYKLLLQPLFGRSERSKALVAALGLERPDDWSDDGDDADRR